MLASAAAAQLRTPPGASAASIGANLVMAGGEPDYQGWPQIAANPNNPQQLVAIAFSTYRDPSPACQSPTGGVNETYGTPAIFASSDGGANWTYQCAPWPATLTSDSSQLFFRGFGSTVAWDARGNAYAAYVLASGQLYYLYNLTAVVCYRSTDGGSTWNSYGTIVNDFNNSLWFDELPNIAVDNSGGPPSATSHPGRVYAIWDSRYRETIAYTDDGVTWTTNALPTISVMVTWRAMAGNVKVGADGTVYAIWNLLNGGSDSETQEETVFSKSVDGGNTWSPLTVVTSHILLTLSGNRYIPAQDKAGINAFASLDVDANPASPYFGHLYLVYTDYAGAVDTDVYMRTSADGGNTWLPAVKMSDDSGKTTEFFPWLSVDPTDGSVNVAWYDTRADSANEKVQVYYARSSNGGTSFEPNQLVTDGGASWVNHVAYSNENSSANVNAFSGQYGFHLGIAAINRQVHPVWTDSRQFYPIAGDSRVEDVATATLVNCSAPAMAAPPVIVSSCPPGPSVSWTAPSSWGTNASGGTYSVYRSTSSTLPSGATPLASGLTTTYTDTTATPGTTYYYFVAAKNNCPGTALTPMSNVSPPSAPTAFNLVPDATITAPVSVPAGGTASASVAAVAGATYSWSIANGTINGSSTAATISFTAPMPGTVTLTATIDHGCVATKSFTVAAFLNSAGISSTAIAPNAGPASGGTPFTITGSGFAAGATVLFDTLPATNVVVVNGGTITGVSSPHIPGSSNVIVFNPDKSGTAMGGGFAFQQTSRFDPNSDGVVDPADVFYLVNYLFASGPAPRGWAGAVGSGDANNDGVVDPADIFFTVNYLFANGQKPQSLPQAGTSIFGSINLGDSIVRDGRTFVPVIVTTTKDSAAPQAIALKLRIRGGDVALRRAGVTKDLQPLFEDAPANAWLASFDAATAPIPSGTSVVVAEIETDGRTEVAIDADGTMLCNQSGTVKATAGNGRLGPLHPRPAE